MADTPTPRSYSQTLGDMFDAFLSNQGIRSLRVGSPIVSILEAAAQSDLRNAQDIFNLLTSADLDNATGLALMRIGRQEHVPKLEITPATGVVTISDSGFTKISTRLFQGAPAPIVGSTTIHVVDASNWPAPGSDTKIYIGRGTSSYEGPIRYTALTNVGNHWQVDLFTATTRFHNVSETVILAQGGNRVVGPNTTVRTPQANTATAVEFRTLFVANLPDGETEIPNVEVVAKLSGNVGNVIAGAISEFGQDPFDNAQVTNPGPFTNGHETESDNDYRERIRNVRASRQLGTTLAITTAVTGITAADENKRINSASLVKRFGFPSTLYIDDGTGYEERTAPVAIESLMDDAVGGESHFETTQRPIARAFAITTNTAPFVLRATDKLAVKVGGVTYTHAFNESDFHSISNASAYEVVASINSNPDIAFVARTVNHGANVAVFANRDINEDIEVIVNDSGTDANDGLAFPAGINYTMRLYKNDRLLTKDGQVASLPSLPFAQWNSVSGNQTISLAIDGTPAISFTFEDQDFIDAQTGYATLGRNSLAAWAAVFNAKVPGITASENAGRLILTSNAGPVEKASLEVTDGTLVSAHFFGLDSAAGAPRDYVLDRNEAQIALSAILEAGDSLTAGSFATRAFLETDDLAVFDLVADADLWWIVDGDAEIVEHGVNPGTPLTISVPRTLDWGNDLNISASPSSVFDNVETDDWMILWDEALPAGLLGVHRVTDSDGTSVTIERHTSLTMRAGHKVAALASTGATIGKILVCGGGFIPRSDLLVSSVPAGVLKTVELYDHNTQTTTPVTPMNVARAFHTATTLANGKVVVVGGSNDSNNSLTSIETYDPVADTWTTAGVALTTGRKNHTATLLTDGRILIAGGDQGGGGLKSYQIYSPAGGTISAAANMVDFRSRHRAIKLADDTVLIVGGFDNTTTDLATCEIFTPGPDTTAATGSLNVARSGFGLGGVGTPAITKVIAVGNHKAASGNDSYETFVAGVWTGPTTTGNLRFEDKDVTAISNGSVVGIDGWNSANQNESRGFSYDGTTFTQITVQPPSAGSGVFALGARFDSEYVEVQSGDGTTFKNHVASIGGNWQHGTEFNFQSTSVLSIYNAESPGWESPDAASGGPYTLSDTGIAFVRSNGFVQKTTIPAGTNYTASSVVDVLNDSLKGATASLYKTTKFRVNTNNFDITGDIALVTQDVEAVALLLDTGDAIDNTTSHLGSVQAASGLGTPSFEDVRIVSQEKGTSHPKPVLTSVDVDVDYTLVGLKNWWRGTTGSTFHTSYVNKRSASNYQFRTRLSAFVNTGVVSSVDTRDASPQPWGPWDRAYLAAPYAMGPNDVMNVIVDNDLDKRYSINMWRNLTTVGSTYTSTNTFKDGDAGDVTLVDTFGDSYDFNEFAVYMPARALAYSADAGRRMLFRYFRLGPDGNDVNVRFGNPDAADEDLLVDVDQTNNGQTNITIKLKSGSARAVTVHNSTRVGSAVTNITAGGTATILKILNLPVSSASRTTNVDTLTLTLPATITNHGLQVGDNVWVESTDVNFSSGIKTITGVAPTTIDYAESAGDIGATANIGTVSFDSQGEATYSGSGTLADDFWRLNDPSASPAAQTNATFQVATVPAGGHHVTVLSGDQLDGGSLSTATTLDWTPILVAENLTVFANSPQTATAIAAAINALRNATSSTCPISATITGTGASTISQNSSDQQDDSQFYYTLTDGVNWVKTTTIGADYSLAFKKTTTSSLASNSDWANETVRIVPITTETIVEWLNTPVVTGLWTQADIEAADNGTRVQISTLTAGSDGGVQIQGGIANSVSIPVVGSAHVLSGRAISTIALPDGDGIAKNQWVRIQNESPLAKLGIVTTGTILNSWDVDGVLTFSAPIVSENLSELQMVMQFERQGRFVAISDTGTRDNSSFGFVQPGDWVRIRGPQSSPPAIGVVSTPNQGLFRVVRVTAGIGATNGIIFIENDSAIEENVECSLTVFASDSVMPGDSLVVLDDTWGADNIGVWTVSDVDFSGGDNFTVDVSTRTPVPVTSPAAALGDTGTIFIREGTPSFYVMRVHGITLNQDDGDFLDIRWDKGFGAASVSGAAGSVITVLDKLEFPTAFAAGADGYRYDTGLLREANKVVYGDPANPTTYPGVAAADSHINIQGPLVKRIQVGLSIRVKSGLNTQDIANRVRSAVATVINQTAIGKSIAFSDIIDAARDVVGVVSVTIVSPLYSVTHDQIEMQPYEKPYVLDLAQDVQVSFLGT